MGHISIRYFFTCQRNASSVKMEPGSKKSVSIGSRNNLNQSILWLILRRLNALLEAKTRMAALVAWIQGIQSITSMANTKKRVHISPPFAGTRNYPISPRIYNKTPSSLHKLTHFLPKPSFSHHSIYKSTRDKNEIDSGARGRSHKKHIHNTLSSFTRRADHSRIQRGSVWW
jgi:hypothetical protein